MPATRATSVLQALACLDRAGASGLRIAAELAGVYAARQLSCRGWND